MSRLAKKIETCRQCDLYLNQAPLVASGRVQSRVMWVGISAQKVRGADGRSPLGVQTKTGAVIAEVEKQAGYGSFYKTNMVKCLPLDEGGKIRYPSQSEMKACFPNLLAELASYKPQLVILLGRKPADYFGRKFEILFPESESLFDYRSVRVGTVVVYAVHHPSYVLIYKRKKLNDYISALAERIKLHGNPDGLFVPQSRSSKPAEFLEEELRQIECLPRS